MDGKYVVKMGEYYLSYIRGRNDDSSVDMTLEKDVRDAKLMSLHTANETQKLFGGKVLRINLELEEV